MITDHCSMPYVAADASEPVIAVVVGASRPLRVKIRVSPMFASHGSLSAISGNRNSGCSASWNTRSRMPFCMIAVMDAGRVDLTSCRAMLNHGERFGSAATIVIALLLIDGDGHEVRVLPGDLLQPEQ